MLLPKSYETNVSTLETFGDVGEAHEAIILFKTLTTDLKELGPDPYSNIALEDLSEGVQECLQVRERRAAYEVKLGCIQTKGEGQVPLDVLGFSRHRVITEWSFVAQNVIINDKVVYKLWSETPRLVQKKHDTNPLGPFQDPYKLMTLLR